MQKVSSTKDCYKENIHLKSSFQFTLNRKLEMSLGNNDQKKKKIDPWMYTGILNDFNKLFENRIS